MIPSINFYTFFTLRKIQKPELSLQKVNGLVTRNITVFCL